MALSPEIKKFQSVLIPPDADAFSPTWIIKRFLKCVESYGLDFVTDHRIFQNLRNCQIGALFALGLSKACGNTEHWVAPVLEREETPDVYVYSFRKHPEIRDGLGLEKLHTELKGWDYHNEEDLVNYLKLILERKQYPRNFHVVLYANKQGLELNLPSIAKLVSDSAISNAWIWLLTTVDVYAAPDSYVLACLNGKPGQIDFRLSEELKKHRGQPQAIKLRRGTFQGANSFAGLIDASMPKFTPAIKNILFQYYKKRKRRQP